MTMDAMFLKLKPRIIILYICVSKHSFIVIKQRVKLMWSVSNIHCLPFRAKPSWIQQPAREPIRHYQFILIRLVRLTNTVPESGPSDHTVQFPICAAQPRALLLVPPHLILFCIANLNKFHFILFNTSRGFHNFTELFGNKTFIRLN